MSFNNPNSVNPGNNLHVSGLSHRVDTRDLEAAFSKIGRVRGFLILTLTFSTLCQVKKVSVMYDPHTRESRGFGFVTMESAEEADAAIAALNATDLMGKVLNVEKVISVSTSIILTPLAKCINDKARRGRARTPTPGRYYGPPKRNDCWFISIINI